MDSGLKLARRKAGTDNFRVLFKDLLGRVGVIKTKSGVFQTPHMFPVVDPTRQGFSQEFLDSLGIHAIMTNAYLFKRARTGEKETKNIHQVLGFNETVATDSGAYQILEYGKVGVRPREIVEFQEKIDTDIGVILDVPTGFKSNPSRARWTVDETVRRADEALQVMTRDDILWVGPIQGGVHLKEVARSAREMSKRRFAIYALGSPTEVMESQRFETLVDMVVTAKKELPPSKPFHLFGAGHPSLFPFLAALGCDLFDSAAYALYARTGRYFTPEGTLELEDMEEFPCSCQACARNSPREAMKLEPGEVEKLLSEHNLQACAVELRKIREAIRNGRLWDLLELRSNAHPAMRRCLNRITHYTSLMERFTPVAKPRGIFYLGTSSDERPELARYRSRILHVPFPRGSRWLLIPGRWRRPYHDDPRYQSIVRKFTSHPDIRICFYSTTFGPVPLELDETYPVAQTESLDPQDPIVYGMKAEEVGKFVRKVSPRALFLVVEGELAHAVRRKLERIVAKSKLFVVKGEGLQADRVLEVMEKKSQWRA